MKKIKVNVIFGGCSSEYNISLISASSVIRNIAPEKYDLILVGVTKKGDFYLYNGDINNIENDTWFDEKTCQKITYSTNRSDHGFINLETNEVTHIDIAFPIMHGRNGEDGRLQGLFELASIPYIGCDMLSSSLCMNKYLAHLLVGMNDICVPKSYLFKKNECTLTHIKETIKDLPYPIFVKPLRAGSSYGISCVRNESELEPAIKEALKYDTLVTIEEGIDGFEVGCAILGNEDAIVGEVDEIDIANGFFDYDQKYTSSVSKSVLPARLDIKTREKIKDTALKIYDILGCKDYARIDMFYTKDGKIVFNEVNNIPGFTTHSRFPSMLNAVGYNFKDIVDKLIEMEVKNAQIHM